MELSIPPRVSFTPEALDFLAGHAPAANQSVTVTAQFVTSCCGPNLPPQVSLGKPADAEGFERVAVEGYDVYIDSLLLPLPTRLVLDLARYERFSELTVRDDRLI